MTQPQSDSIAVIPPGPVEVGEVIERFPTLRQSLLRKFDDCPLSALFEMQYANGWTTHPQARGTLFHRYAAEFLRTLQRQGHSSMPVAEALEILVEVCEQRGIEPEDIVRLPMRQVPELRMAAIKFAKDNSFSIERLIDVEKQLVYPLRYADDHGQVVERIVTGTLDALLFEAPDGAVVLDWKDTWGLPPEPRDSDREPSEQDEFRGLSYHGFFQLVLYGWLVMRTFPTINRVTLREFYPRHTKVRQATLTRGDLDEWVERTLVAVVVLEFDRAVASGLPPRPYKVDTMGLWKPEPGRHCGFCARARSCPVDEDTRIESGAPPNTPDRAAKIAAELNVVDRARKVLIEAAKGWVETTGAPIPVQDSKGRRVLGWYRNSGGGRRFGFYVPDDSDRGGHPADLALGEAMEKATARAKAERDKGKRRRRKTPA